MTISILADFEGFSNATALTNANSDDHGDHATSEVFPGTSGIIETSTTRAAEGSSSLRFSQSTSSQQCRVRYNPGANFTQGAVSFYIHPTGIPGTDANFPFRIFTDVGGSCFQVLTRTTGVLRLANSAGAVQASTASPGILSASPATFFRIEVQWSALNGASSVLALQLFAEHSTTPLTNGSISASSVTTGNGRELVFGKTSTAVLADWWIDGIQVSVDDDTPIGPWPVATNKVGVDTFALSEAAALNQGRTANDTITLTDTFTSLVANLSRTDEWTLTEEVTETEVNDNTDSAVLTETASLTSATVASDAFLQGDDVSASIPTGDQAVSWGGALSNNYFVAAEADVSDLSVADKGLLYTAAGAVKEPTLFHITSFSAPAFGFVNVFVTPDFATAAVSGDVWKEVTPAGSHLAKSQALTDTQTLSGETADLTQGYVGTDTFTLSESASLNTGDVQKTGSDTFGLTSETASLTTADAKAGSDTQTLSEGATALSRASAGVDTQTLSEAAATLSAALSRTDSFTMADSALLASPVVGTDTFVLNEQASSVTAAVAGTETHTLSEASSLTTQDSLSGSDAFTQSEGATVLARSSSLVDTATQSEGTTVHTTTTVATDTQTLSQESSSLSGGSNPTGSDSQTLSTEVASVASSVSGTDSWTLNDVASISAATTSVDSATQTEAPAALTQGYARTDTFSMSDLASLQTATSLSGSDLHSLSSETAVVQEVTFRAGTDQQILSESAQVTVSVSASDSAFLTESAGGTALLTANDMHTLVDMPGDALRLFQMFGSDTFFFDDQSILVQDDLDDDAFPVLNVRWPGVIIPGNIKFPFAEE